MGCGKIEGVLGVGAFNLDFKEDKKKVQEKKKTLV